MDTQRLPSDLSPPPCTLWHTRAHTHVNTHTYTLKTENKMFYDVPVNPQLGLASKGSLPVSPDELVASSDASDVVVPVSWL